MSWVQNLCETYERCVDTVGVSTGGNQEKMLLPVGHALKETSVVIHLKSDGTFAYAEKSDAKICIPITDNSEGRSSGGASKYPHPLFDQPKYVMGDIYRQNLSDWCDHLGAQHSLARTAIQAILIYVSANTLNDDLQDCKIKSDEKTFVRFCVEITGQFEDRLWMLSEMWNAWNDYVDSINANKEKSVCYASGKDNQVYTEKHPKSINRKAGNAKLISGNDSSNFTFRGRFKNSAQAVTISYEASQKAHQALRWLIANHGYSCGTQAIVAWAVDEKPEVIKFSEDSFDIYRSSVQTASDKLIEAEGVIASDYAKLLRGTLCGFGDANKMKSYVRRVTVMATDSATTGRMAITYYRELNEGEYIERVLNWHNTCKWHQPFNRGDDDKLRPGYFIGAPSIDRITEAFLGKKRSKKDESYDKLKKRAREQLLHCVFDGERIPRDMVNAAVYRASNPFALEKTDRETKTGDKRWHDWEQALCVTCALVKRYCHDYKKEEYEVILEESRQDRDYLYGRLLAVADRIELEARYKQRKTKDDARATNAIRYMPAFSHHPLRTWNMLWDQLNPYVQQLNGAGWYLNIIGDIKERFISGEYESDAALSGVYLLGYFAQRQNLRNKTNKPTNKGE